MVRLLSLALFCFLAAPLAHAEPITLTAADGLKVYGEVYRAATARNAPLILAFHQAGSSHAEYAPLALRLNQAGFTVLTIDQRSGGGEFGGSNKTVTALGRSADYDAALADLEAALAWGKANAQGAPLLVWGSSYSAALVFLLAARHPDDITALLAFSPGEYLKDPKSVRAAAAHVGVPVFVTQASDAEEIEQSRAILKAVKSADKQQALAHRGVHGSATLRADTNAAGAEENWAAVMRFLARFKPG